jgi:murein DD-endopeptidase MepM/ murein hydrolase activator NlpD
MRVERKTRPARLPGEPVLEVQIHPADIRRRVRCYFLSRRQVGLIATVGLASLLYIVANLALLPGVLSDHFSYGAYQALVAERALQGERLQELIAGLGSLTERTDQLDLQMQRILLAYGLESGESVGQGGFPSGQVQAGVPDSIYAGTIRRANAMESALDERLGVLAMFLEELRRFEEAHAGQVRTTPSMTPIKSNLFVLTSPFGNRRSPFTKKTAFHAGLDMAAPQGTPVTAPADGVVVFAGRYPLRQSVSWWRYGNLVALRNGERFITLFGHCDELKVRSGEKVRQGQVIATVGNTGWSTSPHLHYEVRRQSPEGEFVPVDPRIYILDHEWRDQEQLLVRARLAPSARDYEPLPRIIGR